MFSGDNPSDNRFSYFWLAPTLDSEVYELSGGKNPFVDNSKTYAVSFDDELKRVMAHGLLHIIGYNDKTEKEKVTMSQKETDALKMFHVKQV